MSERQLITFTGPAGRNYFDSDGVLQTASKNEIREEYDPLTGAYRGVLIESQDRTNYTPNSRNLGGIPGNEDGSTKTAPDGSEVPGYKIAGNNFFERFEGWDDSDDSLTNSVWVCANKPVTLKIRKPLDSGREEVDCHITTEWQRFSATSFRENGYHGGENKTILDGRHISDESIVVYAFGFQVESGPVPTSYIETNGSPKTLIGEAIEINPIVNLAFDNVMLYANCSIINEMYFGGYISSDKQNLIPIKNGKSLVSFRNGSIKRYVNGKPFQSIRYIRDWVNGNSRNDGSHWVEIKAFSDGVNVALGKTVSGNGSEGGEERVTNGDLESYYNAGNGKLYNVVVDLGGDYDVNFIQVWHYYKDGRSYNETKTEVSTDGVNWITVFNSAISGTYEETSEGIVHEVPILEDLSVDDGAAQIGINSHQSVYIKELDYIPEIVDMREEKVLTLPDYYFDYVVTNNTIYDTRSFLFDNPSFPINKLGIPLVYEGEIDYES